MKEANPGPDGRRLAKRAKKNNKAWGTRIKRLSADLPEKVASTSGSGEISTYKMPNTTASEITHFSQADIGKPYYPISVTVKRLYESEKYWKLTRADYLSG